MDFSSFICSYMSLNDSGMNLILLIIGGCSVLGVAIFIERIWHLKKCECDTNQLLIDLRGPIEQGNIIEAVSVCERYGGSIANIVKSGITRHNHPKEKMESAMALTGLVEIADLERNAKVLSMIAHITPLIGLLGTVLGFLQAFGEMRQLGLVDISATRIGAAMEYALITTAAGLAVAIPAVIAYNYLVSRVETFVLEAQTTSSEILDLLTSTKDAY